MSVKLGGGSTEDRSPEQEPPGDWRVLAHMPAYHRAYLFDYCYGMLRNPVAAADTVGDTLAAAEGQIGKLRDPGRLQPWLYSIARRQCLSAQPRRRRTGTAAGLAAGQLHAARTWTADQQVPDLDDEEREQETILVVATALDGLSDRDRELLSLVFKHGVGWADLAVITGVSPARARRLVARAGRRFGKSAAVAVVLRRRWAGCETLARIVGDRDPDLPWLTPRLRRRLIRHISSCDTCTWNRGDMAFGPELLGAVPLAVPPAEPPPLGRTASGTGRSAGRREVAARLGSLDKDGFPGQPDARRAVLRAVAASSVAVIVLAAAGVQLYDHSRSPAGQRKTLAEVAPGAVSPTPVISSLAPAGTGLGHHRRVPLPGTHSLFPGTPGLPAPVTPVSSSPPPVGVQPSPPHHKKPAPSKSPPPGHLTSPPSSPSSSPSPSSSASPSPSPSSSASPSA